ncbi:MAG: FeoB small GTPase domain-containing protein [Prosthecobacter sp.]
MSTPASKTPLIAIVGNPNSGKTTIFNLLTGLKQKVANYPGVTVEKKIGECYSQHGKKLRLIDLPGAYSLNARSPDEAVLRDVLLGRRPETPRPDRVVCVIDSANIERNFYLVSQVLELGLPTILVLNMVDVAEQREWRIDADKLGERLGIPVVKTQAVTGQGIIDLKIALSREDIAPSKWQSAVIPAGVRAALENSRGPLCETGAIHAQASLLEPLYLLSDHDPTHYGLADSQMARVHELRKSIDADFPGWRRSGGGAMAALRSSAPKCSRDRIRDRNNHHQARPHLFASRARFCEPTARAGHPLLSHLQGRRSDPWAGSRPDSRSLAHGSKTSCQRVTCAISSSMASCPA